MPSNTLGGFGLAVPRLHRVHDMADSWVVKTGLSADFADSFPAHRDPYPYPEANGIAA
ncbi:hypothetical protein HGP14_30810 [Rhizobium sp. P32RR-XVIII]|uniref:hypothetical protein n=1 Tax=Rhizobium sp. P32RR-XVIII TaxID=2726738 RepID=UPI0014574059|nr:hypothetical protein [Rhizobium sp. P32RR-XVIII]NLS07653.1 hypothetical protein [Rhizobium sp. P32RR-XVIII]